MDTKLPFRLATLLAITLISICASAQGGPTLQDFLNPDPSVRINAFYALIPQAGTPITDDPTRLALFGLLSTETSYIVSQDQLGVDNEDDTFASYYADLVDVIASLRDIRSLNELVSLIHRGSIVTDALASFGPLALDSVVGQVGSTDSRITTGVAIVLKKMLASGNTALTNDPVALHKIGAALEIAMNSSDPSARQVATQAQAELRSFDTAPPIFSCVPPTNVGLWHGANLSFNCTAQDILTGLNSNSPATFILATAVPVGTETANALTNSQLLCDLAGNCVTAGPIGGNMIDLKPPTINVTEPVNGATFVAYQAVNAAYTCVDLGSGVATCAGTVPTGNEIDTAPSGTLTTKTFKVNTTDVVGNPAAQTVTYQVSCHYVALGVSPMTTARGSMITVNGNVMSCTSGSQKVSVEFALSGPLGPKSCANSRNVMFTSPPFTIPAGTSKTISFPFFIPKSSCAGQFTITTTTLAGGAAIDSSSATLTVD